LYQTEFARLVAEARNLIDPRQINAQECLKFLRKTTCELPAAAVVTK